MALEKKDIQKLAETHTADGDPTGWFEQVYKEAGGDISQVIWADLVANPCLVDWLQKNRISGKRAIVIGCGLGDDVALLAEQSFEVVGFDISQTAIRMCRQRFPEIRDFFQVADLFALPWQWNHNFDLVFECNTIQALSAPWRGKALNAIAGLVAPDGVALVNCRSRNTGEREDEFPLPLDQNELAGFERAGLKQLSLESYVDDQEPPFPHFIACYQRTA